MSTLEADFECDPKNMVKLCSPPNLNSLCDFKYNTQSRLNGIVEGHFNR